MNFPGIHGQVDSAEDFLVPGFPMEMGNFQYGVGHGWRKNYDFI
jgi:hypothetical protein